MLAELQHMYGEDHFCVACPSHALSFHEAVDPKHEHGTVDDCTCAKAMHNVEIHRQYDISIATFALFNSCQQT